MHVVEWFAFVISDSIHFHDNKVLNDGLCLGVKGLSKMFSIDHSLIKMSGFGHSPMYRTNFF